MVWMAVAGIALSALQGQSSAKNAAANSRAQQADSYTQSLLNTQREIQSISQNMDVQSKNNQAIAKADIQSLVNTNYMMGLLNVQRGLQQQQVARSRTQLGSARLNALAQAETSAAASGTIGASVDAVVSDIHNKVGQAELDLGDQYGIAEMNYESQVHNLYQGYVQSQQSVDVSTPNLPANGAAPNYVQAPSLGNSIAAATINYTANHLAQRMTLGLGASKPAPVVDRSFKSF